MKLFFREYGSGQPMIILHGLLGMSDHWIPLAKKFPENFHVIVPDLRNHGQSSHDSEFNYEAMQSDIIELLQELGIKKSVFIGHSMGGKLAMLLALSHPAMVEKLIIADISPVAYPLDADHEMMQVFNKINPETAQSRNELQQMITETTTDPLLQGLIVKNIIAGINGSFRWKPDMNSISRNLERIFDFPDLKNVSYNKPALFIKGSRSNYIRRKDFQTINMLFTSNRILTIENAGHWLHAEKPNEFFQICIDFLKPETD